MTCSCCCQVCSGGGCCGSDWPQHTGVCCEGVWRVSGGVCCDGVWYVTGTPGVCCEDQWRTEAGDCCNGVWYPAIDPCPEGQVFLRWGPNNECCGCVPDMVFDSRVDGEVETASVAAELCCGCESTPTLPFGGGGYVGCIGRCCVDGECTETLEANCAGVWLTGCCERGCPAPCCSEDSDGLVQCEVKDPIACNLPSAIGDPDCETGCLGECCIDGVSIGQKTQPECFALGGQWAGVGSTACQGENECRTPFSAGCCETKVSSAAGLTFTQPRFKRTPPFDGTLRVTVTGTTDSAILIHGTPFGVNATPSRRCPVNHTFLICWDEFHVEPVPCGTNFKRVDLTVCWSQEATPTEELNFSGCNGLTIRLGDYARDCITTLSYVGSGHTSNSTLVLRNSAVISANGTGALVLTTAFSVVSPSNVTLTLTGDSLHNNSVAAIANPPGYVTNLLKQGSGRWVLTASSTYTGSTTVEQGELVLGVNQSGPGAGALGNGGSLTVGGSSGTASLLLKAGLQIDSRTLTIPAGSQAVRLGGVDTSGTATFASDGSMNVQVGRDVTLVAPTGSTSLFSCAFYSVGGSHAIIIGAAGLAGTVIIGSPDVVTSSFSDLRVYAGTAILSDAWGDDIVHPSVALTVGAATLDLNTISQAFVDILFDSTGGSIINGTLRIPAAVSTIESLSTGNTISAAMQLEDETAFKGSFSVSGVVSGVGSILKQGGGTVTLSGANTFSGGTTIDGGAMTAGNVNAFGTGDIVVNAGGTLNKNGYTLPNTITNNGGTVNG